MRLRVGKDFKGEVWFTADSHYNHGNIIKYCNRNIFLNETDKIVLEKSKQWHNGNWKGTEASKHRMSHKTIETMTENIIDLTNKYVGKDDILIHAGDVLFAPDNLYYSKCKEILDKINCKNIHLVWGNHDDDEYSGINRLFKSTSDVLKLDVRGQKIIVCHYAMAIWDKSHRKSWQLYGHSHSEAEGWLDKMMPGRRSMDVGVDNIYKLFGEYRPISFHEINNIMINRPGHSIGDHHIDPNNPTEESIQ